MNLSEVDVLEFLELLQVDHVTDDGKEARFSCPYPAHGMGDKNPSAYMNLESTAWTCFSCGKSGNAITFLSDVKQVSRLTAKEWIAQKWAPYAAEIDDLLAYAKQVYEKSEMVNPFTPFVPLPEETIGGGVIEDVSWNLPTKPCQEYLLHRDLSSSILDQFGFVYDSIADRPCITVRTPEGGLVGFKGRAWHEGQWPKYMVAGDTARTIEEHGVRYGFEPYDASHWVFGAHLAQPINGRLILCEGELNVVSMHDKGFTNVVGPSGSTLSQKQIDQIVKMCDEVVILFDSDMATPESYATAQAKIAKAMNAFEKYIDVRVCGDHTGDPAELDRETLRRLVDEAPSSTMFKALARLREVN